MSGYHEHDGAATTLHRIERSLCEAVEAIATPRRDSADGETDDFYVPGPLQDSGQDEGSLLQHLQRLVYEPDDVEEMGEMYDEQKGGQDRLTTLPASLAERALVPLLAHGLVAYLSMLERDRLRHLTTRLTSDTTLWLCRLFRFDNGSAYFHEDDREGLVRVALLALHSRYQDFATEGFCALAARPPVLYVSAAARPGLGMHLCTQLGLPVSCLCTVPCNTVFGSQHQMDIASFERLVADDKEAGRLPLLLLANAGTPAAGHTDKFARLSEICSQHGIWLHVEGVTLATLVLGFVPSAMLAAVKSDSMTLTPGIWLGLPATPAVTLYRHDDPSLALAASLVSSRPADRLRPLPLWLSLQLLGNSAILQCIRLATQLSQNLLDKLKLLPNIKISVHDEVDCPVVIFKFVLSKQNLPGAAGVEFSDLQQRESELQDSFNRWLCSELRQAVPASGLSEVELDDDGLCLRFSPLVTAAALGTSNADMESLCEALSARVPTMLLSWHLRTALRHTALSAPPLAYLEERCWAGLGALRYEVSGLELHPSHRQVELEKFNQELGQKLKSLLPDAPLAFGPRAGGRLDCVYIGMVTEELDMTALVQTIVEAGREVEERGRLLENMTDMVLKGIQEAEEELQKSNQKKLQQEGVLRQLPIVSSMLNWFSPVHASPHGQTFNLIAGSLASTEKTYECMSQATQNTPPPSPTVQSQHPVQRIFHRTSSAEHRSSSSRASSVDTDQSPSSTEPANAISGHGEPGDETEQLPDSTSLSLRSSTSSSSSSSSLESHPQGSSHDSSTEAESGSQSVHE
uniref:pyridoxal-dependent decarboxylase domain-containing protein 1 isoform X2 n=1 Tax=Myxine glutinosa TaxID=7769 RepID=UPI00358EA79F